MYINISLSITWISATRFLPKAGVKGGLSPLRLLHFSLPPPNYKLPSTSLLYWRVSAQSQNTIERNIFPSLTSLVLEIKVYVIGDSPDKNRTITTELTIANQWIWTSLIAKYVSHREAQTISLACTKVIKRNTISHSDDYKALHNSIPLFLWPFNHKSQKYEHSRIFSEYLMWLMKWELRTCKKRNPNLQNSALQ